MTATAATPDAAPEPADLRETSLLWEMLEQVYAGVAAHQRAGNRADNGAPPVTADVAALADRLYETDRPGEAAALLRLFDPAWARPLLADFDYDFARRAVVLCRGTLRTSYRHTAYFNDEESWYRDAHFGPLADLTGADGTPPGEPELRVTAACVRHLAVMDGLRKRIYRYEELPPPVWLAPGLGFKPARSWHEGRCLHGWDRVYDPWLGRTASRLYLHLGLAPCAELAGTVPLALAACFDGRVLKHGYTPPASPYS